MKVIHNFIVLYLITLSLLISILIFEMIILNSYDIYLIYSLLLIVHFTGIFFSVWGTIKFLYWFKSNKDELLLVYVISFIIILCLDYFFFIVYYYTELETLS